MQISKFKLLFIFILIGMQLSCKTVQKFMLSQPYYFLGIDNEMPMIELREDSIYSMKCHIPFNCTFYGNNRQIAKRVEVVQHKKETYLIKTISDTAAKDNRYWQPDGYWVVKKLNENSIRQYTFFPYLVQDIETAKRMFNEVVQNENSPGFTMYTKTYIEQFKSKPSIATVADVDKLISLIMSEKYKIISQGLAKEKRGDMYGSGLGAELYTLASIELGFNPVGAGLKIDSISRANREYFDKKYGL